MRRCAAVLIILVSLAVPFVGAVVPDDTRQAGGVVTGPDLNVTGADITNHTIPARYGISPTPIDIKVEISETGLPGPKGEMAAGPRSIGFATDPISLLVLIVAIIAASAGIWYLVKKKADEEDNEDGGDN